MLAKSKSKLIFLLAFVFLLSLFSIRVLEKPVLAQNNVNYKQKIVSVVYDDSGSMANYPSEQRPQLAKYSLQMLASMLSSQDELIVCPMNKWNTSNPSFTVNLKATDREAEFDSKIVNNSALSPTGGTPEGSIGAGVKELVKRGLKLASELENDEDIDKEYWLIMLTDGGFESKTDPKVINDMIVRYIKGYAGLNTVYLSFGKVGSIDLRDKNLSLNKDYAFTPYYIPEPTKISEAMTDIANKILGRYGLDSENYSVSDKKVSIDFSNLDFSINSVSVMAQNCGAKITNVTYNGKKLTPTLASKIVDCGLAIESGFIAQIKDSSYISGGKLEIEYDRTISKSNITVLVEPAIYIDAYVEAKVKGNWEPVDMQYINSNLQPNDEIRVRYKVYNSSDGKELNLNEIFVDKQNPSSAPVEKVTYCNKGYGIGESIKLQKGRNEIVVLVSVLNSTYTMKSTLMCYIELNPTAYRLTAERSVSGKQVDFIYTVYSDDKALTDISDYDFTVEALDSKGNPVDVSTTKQGNGKMKVHLDGNNLPFDEYTINAKVINKESKLSRVCIEKFSVLPQTLDVKCLTTDVFETSVYKLEKDNKKVEFALKLDGKDESFDNAVINYSVKIGDKDVTNYCVIENGKLVFTISKDTLENKNVGDYTIEVKADAMNIAKDSDSYKFKVINSAYTVEVVDRGVKEFDRYDIASSKACISFKITIDGISLSNNELQSLMDNGEIVVNTNPFGWLTLLPCGTVTNVEEFNGQAVVSIRVVPDIFSPLDNLLASFVFPNEKDITLEFNGISATDTIFIKEVSFMSRFIRWIIILIILLIILHIILYIVGFFTAKPLEKGTVVRFSVSKKGYAEIRSYDEINMGNEVLLWHLSRFIPFCELKNQKPNNNTTEFMFKVDKASKSVVAVVDSDSSEVPVCLASKAPSIDDDADGMKLKSVLKRAKAGAISTVEDFRVKSSNFNSWFDCMNSDDKKYIHGNEISNTQSWYVINEYRDDETFGIQLGYIIFVPYEYIDPSDLT